MAKMQFEDMELFNAWVQKQGSFVEKALLAELERVYTVLAGLPGEYEEDIIHLVDDALTEGRRKFQCELELD